MKKFAGSVLIFLIMTFVPLFSFWWFFFILAALATMWGDAFYSIIFSGFVLDSIYSTATPYFPLLTISGLILASSSLFIKNRLRF